MPKPIKRAKKLIYPGLDVSSIILLKEINCPFERLIQKINHLKILHKNTYLIVSIPSTLRRNSSRLRNKEKRNLFTAL